MTLSKIRRWRVARHIAVRYGYTFSQSNQLLIELGEFGASWALYVALSEGLDLCDAKLAVLERAAAIGRAAKMSGVSAKEALDGLRSCVERVPNSQQLLIAK